MIITKNRPGFIFGINTCADLQCQGVQPYQQFLDYINHVVYVHEIEMNVLHESSEFEP